MVTSPTAQRTHFSYDVIGRYVCNGLDEALASMYRPQTPEARPFDLIILGGGAFGSYLAHQLFFGDTWHNHRILVLEAGPLAFTDHVQNLLMLGLEIPGPTSIAELRAQGRHGVAHNEIWGLSWHSDQRFPGLAYCLGGRSLFSSGWAPRPLATEMPTSFWPEQVVRDLHARHFDAAARQIGVDAPNDSINGRLHDALRRQLFEAISQVPGAIPLAEVPEHLTTQGTSADDVHKLDAPLAVHSAMTSGTQPIHRFSGAPLLIRAARAAWVESNGDDTKKRLMVVPHCHVEQLITEGDRVTSVQTNQGSVPVPDHGRVILALGTIESARLALESFQGIPHYEQIGRNLMTHQRSTVIIRLPRTSLVHLDQTLAADGLQVAALFLKGRHQRSDSSTGHFHLQITAAGLDDMGMGSRAELFRKIPDVDTVDVFHGAGADDVIIMIRGFAEMLPSGHDGADGSNDAGNRITLDPELDEYGLRRAFVSLRPSDLDLETWSAMDRAIDAVVHVFANGQRFVLIEHTRAATTDPATRNTDPPADAASASSAPGDLTDPDIAEADLTQVVTEMPRVWRRHDDLGATHQEAGTLRMGLDATASVTDPTGRFHHVGNAYAVGPAVFPTIGSSNPMLTGIALTRRTADILIERPQPPRLEPGFTYLFDGTQETYERWRRVGAGGFRFYEGHIVTYPRNQPGMLAYHPGLLYYTGRQFGDFTLRLQFRLDRVDDNSGVFVRFRDPRFSTGKVIHNRADVAIATGFEAQIDENARGDPGDGIPDGLSQHRTGAIFGIPIGLNAGEQDYRRGPQLRRDAWYEYEITVQGDTYTVRLNQQITTQFTNTDPCRGKPPSHDPHSGYIGLEARTGRVTFRRICIKELPPARSADDRARKRR